MSGRPIRHLGLTLALVAGCSLGRPPKGGTQELTDEQKGAIAALRAKVDGLVVWSSSRLGNHDLFLMKTDGSALKRLTEGYHVDWYPRFSPDGRRILFCRSKRGWVSEKDANRPEKWDLYTIPSTGGAAKRLVANASWGTWIADDEILYARRNQVILRQLGSGDETVLVDSTQVEALGGADLQNPYLSPDRRFVAITLRGGKRETGIFDLEQKSWVATGKGCQINWFPSGARVLWVNPSGNGGSEVFSVPVAQGKPTRDFDYEEMRLVDIPGRRSHEYFPQLDRAGKWMVWAATQRGHDHDIADYEIYIWQVGAPAEQATRLTFHSGNDRWPDIHLNR
jgi:hypothetical protein